VILIVNVKLNLIHLRRKRNVHITLTQKHIQLRNVLLKVKLNEGIPLLIRMFPQHHHDPTLVLKVDNLHLAHPPQPLLLSLLLLPPGLLVSNVSVVINMDISHVIVLKPPVQEPLTLALNQIIIKRSRYNVGPARLR